MPDQRKTRKKRLIEPGPRVCHPRLKGKYDECLSDERLYELSRAYNVPPSIQGKQEIRQWMTRKANCKTERCLIEKAPIDQGKKKYLLRRYYRPSIPKEWLSDPDQWLDSNNIQDVMKQYEETYPHFKFYGANPIDFAAPDPYDKEAAAQNKCLNDDICKLNLKDLLKRGKTQLGFVYNLDPSNKGGSHWIASFTDIPGHKTYYFDSYGMKPPAQIARFMRSMTLQDPQMKLAFNARRFQYGDTECGMYSLYFLIRMLEGDDFKKFCKRAPKDGDMIALRKWLFSGTD
jgi:hypothetical protein